MQPYHVVTGKYLLYFYNNINAVFLTCLANIENEELPEEHSVADEVCISFKCDVEHLHPSQSLLVS